MGSCNSCFIKGVGDTNHNSSNDGTNQPSQFPTLDIMNKSSDLPGQSNTLNSKYSITQPPSNKPSNGKYNTSKSNPNTHHLGSEMESKTHTRRHSFESETKQILSDDDVFSREAIRVAHQFWCDNVLILSEDRRQEIGVSLYAQMFRKMPECRKIFLRGDIQETAAKFLGMIGWLVMELSSCNTDVWTKVKKLGKLHRHWGITYENYLPMLQAFHITFQEQFRKSYTLRVKFCIENLFMNAAKIMTEKDFVTLFAERVSDLEALEFLDSLDACLAHQTGREYFERYLEQTFCAEYVSFLRSFDEFKQLGNAQQRYEKANYIYLTNFHISAEAPIELNKEQRPHINALKEELEKYQISLQTAHNESNDNGNDVDHQMVATPTSPSSLYELNENLLDELYADVKKLIEEQSWDKFQTGIYSIKEATRVNTF